MTKKLWQPFLSEPRELGDAHWKALEDAAGLKFAPQHRKRLQDAVRTYWEHADGYAAAIRPGEIKPLLRRAFAALRQLDPALAGLTAETPQSQAALREIRMAAATQNKVYLSEESATTLRADAARWASCVANALAALPDDKGRPADPPIGPLLAIVLSVYSDVGGRGKYTPQALNFCKALCAAVGYRPQSDARLEKLIQKGPNKVGARRAT